MSVIRAAPCVRRNRGVDVDSGRRLVLGSTRRWSGPPGFQRLSLYAREHMHRDETNVWQCFTVGRCQLRDHVCTYRNTLGKFPISTSSAAFIHLSVIAGFQTRKF